MEVLNGEEVNLGGQTLIQTVVSLTELPEPLIHYEVDGILQLSGHKAESLTIEQLRASMLQYLEEIHATMMAECEQSIDDAELGRAPVIP